MRLFSYGAVTLLSALSLVGALHTPALRPLRPLLRELACPMGTLSAHDAEAVQQAAIRQDNASSQPQQRATTHAVFGFTLGATTLNDAQAWASKNSVSCTEKREGSVLTCFDVPFGAVSHYTSLPSAPNLHELSLTFDTSTHTLRDVSAYRHGLATDDARANAIRVREHATELFGAPHTSHGDWALPSLGHYETATMRYHFVDLVADLTVSALPQGTTVQERFGLVSNL
jgi:hypothetical protein